MPLDQGKGELVAAAAVMKEILNYRLTKTIPWFRRSSARCKMPCL